MKNYVITIEAFVSADTDEEAVRAALRTEKLLNSDNTLYGSEVIQLAERKKFGFFNREINIRKVKEHSINKRFIENLKQHKENGAQDHQ